MRREHGFSFRGFTVMEIMIVVVIMAILVMVAVPRYRASMARTRYAEAMQVASTVAKAEAIYAYEHGALTPDLRNLDIAIPVSSSVPGGSYYGWTVSGTEVGFGLGFNPAQSPANVPADHKLGIDMNYNNGSPTIVRYWWREDASGKIGGGAFHTSATGWDGLQ